MLEHEVTLQTIAVRAHGRALHLRDRLLVILLQVRATAPARRYQDDVHAQGVSISALRRDARDDVMILLAVRAPLSESEGEAMRLGLLIVPATAWQRYPRSSLVIDPRILGSSPKRVRAGWGGRAGQAALSGSLVEGGHRRYRICGNAAILGPRLVRGSAVCPSASIDTRESGRRPSRSDPWGQQSRIELRTAVGSTWSRMGAFLMPTWVILPARATWSSRRARCLTATMQRPRWVTSAEFPI